MCHAMYSCTRTGTCQTTTRDIPRKQPHRTSELVAIPTACAVTTVDRRTHRRLVASVDIDVNTRAAKRDDDNDDDDDERAT